MAEPNQHHTQLEPNGVHFGPDDANAGQNGAYQYWQTDPAGIASSSGRERVQTHRHLLSNGATSESSVFPSDEMNYALNNRQTGNRQTSDRQTSDRQTSRIPVTTEGCGLPCKYLLEYNLAFTERANLCTQITMSHKCNRCGNETSILIGATNNKGWITQQ